MLKPKTAHTWRTRLWAGVERLSQRFSPGVFFLGTLTLCLGLAWGVRVVRDTRSTSGAGYQFSYPAAEGAGPVVLRPSRVTNTTGPPLSDPAARYAERLRESASLAVGLTLAAVDIGLRGRARQVPQSLAQAQSAAGQRGLLPPTVRWSPELQAFVGTWGVNYVRYRARPLGVEIVAVGRRGFEDGEIFLLRVPDTGQQQTPADRAPTPSWCSLWVAHQSALVPPPFATVTQLQQTGWRLEALRPGDAQPTRLPELLQWLQGVTPNGR